MSFEQRFLNVRSIVTRMCAGVDLAAQPGRGRSAWKGIPLLMMALIWAAPQLSGQFTFPVQPLGNIWCVYSAVPNQVRAESLADRTGDARLDCLNEGVFNPVAENDMRNYLSTDIALTLNTNLSGLLDASKGVDVPVNETGAVLTINDNNSYFPTSDSVLPAPDTCGIVGSSPLFKPDKRYPCPQKGVLAAPNTITWNSIQFPVPGAPNNPDVLPPANGDGIPICTDIFDQESSDSCFNPVTTVRITNIVANVAAIGAGGDILGTLTISGISVTPTNQRTLSNIFEGLTTDSEAEGGAFQCSEGIRVVNIELHEGFGGAFKTIGAPSFVQGDFAAENGYPVLELTDGFPPQPAGGTGGGATQATRFLIRLFNVPPGVVPEVPNTIDELDSELEGCVPSPGGKALCLQRVEGADQDGAGGAIGDGVGDFEIPLVGGQGFVVYEVVDGDPFLKQDIVVPISFTCMPGSPTRSLFALASFAPLSTQGQPVPFGPVPRFIDDSDFFPIIRRSDLSLTKTAEPTVVTPGVSQVVYTLGVVNYGPSGATDVEVIDILPPGMTYVSDDAGCVVAGSTITCAVGKLAAQIHITASVDADASGVLTNNASVSSENPEPAPDPHSNFASVSITVNRDPVADAGPDQTINAPGPGGVDVVLDGSGSSDPDGDPLTYTWTGAFGIANGVMPTVILAAGVRDVTLTVNDGRGGTDTDTVEITVNQNQRPIAVAGPDQTFNAPSPGGVAVTLNGSGSSDPDGDPLSYTWTGPFGMAMGVSSTVTIPGGVHTLTLTVSDGKGGTAADTVTVTVRALRLTPTSLNFVLPQGADPTSQSFTVQALGGTIPYSIARTASWLNSSPGGGQSSGEQDALQAIVDPGNLNPGNYTGRLVVNGPGVIKETLTVTLTVSAEPGGGGPPVPKPSNNGVVDAADYIPFGQPGHAVAPKSVIAIYGADFVADGEFRAETVPLPTTLGGVQVKFDGVAAPLIVVSPNLIVAQLPMGVKPPSATMIITNGLGKAASEPKQVRIAAYSPGIFTLTQNGEGQGIITFAGTGELAASAGSAANSRPAGEGDYVTIWMNGLGQVEPLILDGHNSCEPDGACEQAGSNVVLHETILKPTIRIGGVEVPEENVLFSGSSVTSVGVNEVVFLVPPGVPAGDHVPITVEIGGVPSKGGVTMAVE